MALFSLPLKTSGAGSSTPQTYDTTIDGTYNIYTATLKNYPVSNAFVSGAFTSQEKWGLQVSARSTQNSAWASQFSFGTTAGTGALSRDSLTYPFTKTISAVDSGSIQTFLYAKNHPRATFNESTKVIQTADDSGIPIADENVLYRRLFVANVGGAKWLIVPFSATQFRSYPLNGSYKATGTFVASTIANAQGSTTIIGAKNNYVWAILNNNFSSLIGVIYTVGVDGVLTEVSRSTITSYSANGGGHYWGV